MVTDTYNNAVIRLFGISVDASRIVSLVNVSNSSTFTDIQPIIDSISIDPSSEATTGANSLIAYRPRYNGNHGTMLGALFFNVEGIFPCLQEATHYIHLSCWQVTSEEDGFRGGNAIVSATDFGNHFAIFNGSSSSERTLTYGMVFQNCPELNSECLPIYTQLNVACLLPRQYCG